MQEKKSVDTKMSSIQELLDQYRFAVMCELEEFHSLEEAIRKQALLAADDQIKNARESAESYRATIRLAYFMGHQGIEKASLEFQSFLERIKDIHDPVLVEAVLCCHDRGRAALLNDDFEQGKADGDNIPQEDESSTNGGQSDQGENADASEDSPEGVLDDVKASVFSNGDTGPDHSAEIAALLKKIEQFRTWRNSLEKTRELNEAIERLAQLDATQDEKARELLSAGKAIANLFEKAWKAGQKNDKDALRDLKKQAWKLGATPDEVARLCMNFDKSKKKAQVLAEERKNTQGHPLKVEIPMYGVEKTHPYFLGNMPSSLHWNVFIDETGSIFDRTVFEQGTKGNDKGKLVALFVPSDAELPALSYHHATDSGTQANQKVLQTLFTKGEGCGILGVTLDAMPNASLDYWYAGLERLIDLSLRFLPEPSEKTVLEFYVENRGADAQEDIDKSKAVIQRTAETCLYRFAKSYPDKADRFELKIHNIAKKRTDDKVFLAYNGYVDTIACAWNGRRKEILGMLKDFGLLHRCLLEGDVQELPFVMDRIAKGENIPLEQWNKLLDSPDISTVDSPVAILMAKQGFAARGNISVWLFYLNEVITHLNSKAIRLTHLNKQLTWLTENMPAETKMPKRLKLIWLTSRLAEANHHGIIAPKMLEELNQLVSDIYVEDAPLSCWAVLNLAVEKTNAYRFEDARQIIRDFASKASLFRDAPPFSDYLSAIQGGQTGIVDSKVAVYGLRYYGQMLSSLGQHEAFLGNHDKANSYLEAAIQCFGQLSENNARDISQTRSYLVTNLMDYQDAYAILPRMEEYLGGTLEVAAKRLAGSSNPNDKYQHLVMLRYFQNLPKDHPAIDAYVSEKKNWKTDAGHPWEMIEFYRALLVDDKEERWSHINRAYDIARTDSGPTILVIACVILGAARYYNNQPSSEAFLKCVNVVIQQVPALGEKRINALRMQATTPIDPLALAKIVLPFNFR